MFISLWMFSYDHEVFSCRCWYLNFTDSSQFGVFRNFNSERYPSVFLVIRRLGPSVPRPLSLSPAGVANPVVGQFNPMIAYFTTLR